MTRTIIRSIIGLAIAFLGILLYLVGWWMFFSYLVSIIGFCFIVFSVDAFEHGRPDNDFFGVTKCPARSSSIKTENNRSKARIFFSSIAVIISLYPGFFMIDSYLYYRLLRFSFFFSRYDTYEGGILVLVMVILVLMFAVRTIVIEFKNLKYGNADRIEISKKLKLKEEDEKLQALELKDKEVETKTQEEQLEEELLVKYGTPTKTIDYNVSTSLKRSLDQCILIFEDVNVILVRKRIYSFKDILSCSITDNSTTTHSGSVNTSKTTTSTGSMLGRAIVGGVLTGGVGAVVGAATAKKETVTILPQTNMVIKHDYTIQINVNSILEPLIKLYLGADEDKVNEIVALFNVIISRNIHSN